MTDGVLLRESL